MMDASKPDEFAAELVDACAPGMVKSKAEALALYDRHDSSEAAQKRRDEWGEQEQGDPALEALRRALLPGLLMIEECSRQLTRQWTRVFRKVATAPIGFVEIQYRGALHRLCSMDSKGGVALRTVLAPERGLEGFVVQAIGMSECSLQVEEMRHANVLDAGRVADAAEGGGTPLFSLKHQIDTGVYSNMLDPASELNEMAVEMAAVAVRKLPDQAGSRALANPKLLVVPTGLEFSAHRLCKGDHAASWPQDGYCVLDYLVNPKAWFLTTTIKGLVSIEKAPFKLDLKVEGDALVLEGSQSYAAGYMNPRGVFGSFPG
jgi:hypothetical protein